MCASLAALLVACQSAPAAPATSAVAPSVATVGACGEPAFVVAALSGMLTLDKDGRVIGHLVDLPPGTFPVGPALGPDGHRIAFSYGDLVWLK